MTASGKENPKTHYQIVSAVLKELVDRDLGFITILILKNSPSIFSSETSVALIKLTLHVFHFKVRFV